MPAPPAIFEVTTPYAEFLAEWEEIERYKWLLSEDLGADVGLERALNEWARRHRAIWRHERNEVLREMVKGQGKTKRGQD